MAHYIVQFTRAGTGQRRGMPEQARDVLRSGLWGVPPKAQLRMRPKPADGVLVAVGAPDRVFVGDAVVAAGYHCFSEEEAARFPSTLGYDHGISLTRIRIWPSAVPVMSVWPDTTAAKTNPRALWFGTINKLSSADAAMIVTAGKAGGHPLSDDSDAPEGESFTVSGSDARPRLRGDHVAKTSMGAAPPGRSPVDSSSGVDGGRDVSPLAAIDHAATALQAASESPPWLPARIAHADWGTTAEKRVVATAELTAASIASIHPGRWAGSAA